MAEISVPTLDDLLAQGVSGRGVLVRSDLNVPLDDEGNITDPGRVTASVPTLNALAEAGAKVVVAAPTEHRIPNIRSSRSPPPSARNWAGTCNWRVMSSGPMRWQGPRV
jgi:hypothetical protein